MSKKKKRPLPAREPNLKKIARKAAAAAAAIQRSRWQDQPQWVLSEDQKIETQDSSAESISFQNVEAGHDSEIIAADDDDDKPLPPGITFVEFQQLVATKDSQREFSLLTGIENGFADLDMSLIQAGYHNSMGSAFSFCLNGRTYTAVESAEDGYRSSLGFLVVREGNFCKIQFEACALWPAMSASEDEDIFELRIEPGGEAAISVGTSYHNSYYPCFVSWHSAALLQRAHDMGIALAAQMDETVPRPLSLPTLRQRL